MKRRSRVLAVAAVPGLLLGAVAATDSASAGPGDVILNPGAATLTVNAGGFFNVGGNELSLPSTATPVQCNDGINNDVAVDDPTKQQDLLIDFGSDTQCGSALDDSEVKPAVQARSYITMNGSVDAAGNISVPQANISFPTFYVYSSQANGIIDVIPSPTGPATGTLDPATGEATMNVDWQLRVVQQFFKIDCTAQISMDLSTDPIDPANSGSIPVSPSSYDPATGDVTITGNNFPISAFVPTNLKSGTTGVATASSTTFTDPNGTFVAGNWTPTGGGDVGKSITIQGAGAGGAAHTTTIASVVNATTVTLQAAPSTSVNPASYTYSASAQNLCDTVGGGFGIVPGSGAPAGANAAQLGVTSTPTFQTGISPAAVSGTVTEAGTGEPAEGVTVSLLEANPSWVVVDTTVTDANGDYAFESVPDGDYQLKFFDSQARYQRTWYSSKGTYKVGDVVTVSGGASPAADQALDPMPTGQISGRVQSSRGLAKPGVRVRIYTEADGYYGGAVTGDDGYYLLKGVPAGTYLVQFWDPAATYPVQQWYQFKALAFNADPVVVTTGTTYASALMGNEAAEYALTLSGANEVPPNASGYSGTATVTLDELNSVACVSSSLLLGAESLTGYHIHQAAAGVNGPVVVNFNAQPNTCVSVSRPTIVAMKANPAGYYLNAHTPSFPGGAIRAQLA